MFDPEPASDTNETTARTGGGSSVRQRSQVVQSSQRPSPWPVPGDRGVGGVLGGGDSMARTDLGRAQECRGGQVSGVLCGHEQLCMEASALRAEATHFARCRQSRVSFAAPSSATAVPNVAHASNSKCSSDPLDMPAPVARPAAALGRGSTLEARSDVSHRTRSSKRDARRPALLHRCDCAVRQEKGSSSPSERTVHSTAVLTGPAGERHLLPAAAESHGPAACVPLGAADTLVPFSS